MVEITSHEQLEEWLQRRPDEWDHVISSRAALFELPYIVLMYKNDSALPVFRASLISWTSNNIPDYEIIKSKEAANYAVYMPFDYPTANFYSVCGSFEENTTTSKLTTKIENDKFLAYFGEIANHAVYEASLINSEIYVIINADRNWLELNGDPPDAAHQLTHQKLWPESPPRKWTRKWKSAIPRLLALDPTYQVWIDWYNRRIEGHDAAFDIPGDIDRVHDKAILARLADATDEDFWGKGATYVNTTLQRWIDEARTEARIDEILRQLRSGAIAHYGAPEELAGHAVLLDELDRLLGKSPQARHGIGGNHPPEPIDAVDPPVALPEEVREPLELISTELEKHEPDALVVVEQVKLLHRIGRKLEKMAGLASDEFAKSVGGELGKWIVQGAFWLTLINQILDWLGPLIR